MQPDYKDFAIDLARQAGAIMLKNFQLGMKKEWKLDDSPLTATDLAINDLVITQVAKTYPDHAVLGEEKSSTEKGSDHLWVVDPVDGTIPFSHGVPTSAFSLALVVNGESQIGVVYDPFMDRLLAAEKGKGATCNGTPIRVNDATTLNHQVVNFDGPWEGSGATGVCFFALPESLNAAGAKTTKFSCMVYGGIMVALGEYAGAVCNGHFPWDIAALKVIVEEAGGKVTDLRGKDQKYDGEIFGAIISNGHVHDELVAMLSKCMPS